MNTPASIPGSATVEALQDRLLEEIKATGHARSTAVEAALRTVPRHRYVPQAPLDDAYADIAVITKRDGDGTALSCASVPTIVAMMLDQLDVQPGDRILEIGAGTGYNAALLATLAGPDGHVTTVDIDPEVTADARRNLDANGFQHVDVVTRDGTDGAAENAPYDRVIFTVGAWDLPAAIWDQLRDGGRLVVPLRWRGQTRSLALIHHDGELTADAVELCGFVPMVGQEGEQLGPLDADGQTHLHWDIDQDIDATALHGVLQQTRTEAWSGVTVGPYDPFDGLWLQMTATEPNVCRFEASTAAVEGGLCTPAIPSRSPALVDDDSLAYFAFRRITPTDDSTAETRSELGAIGHGPQGHALADRLCERIRQWAAVPSATPEIVAQRTDHAAPDQAIVIRKADCALTLRMPGPATDSTP
jgi:protein-L-isoaspartate(D-aspartate) O-methyltransferase